MQPAGAVQPVAEHAGEILDVLAAEQVFDGVGHFAAPVWIFRGAAGQVLLFGFLTQPAAEGLAAPDATFCEERAFSIAAMISVCENGFSTNL